MWLRNRKPERPYRPVWQWIDKLHHAATAEDHLLDMDSSESATYGIRKAGLQRPLSVAPATTRCSCSTSTATLNGARFARAMCTAPMTGARFWNRWSPATGDDVKNFFSRRCCIRHSRVVCLSRSRALQLRDPTEGQPACCRGNRVSAEASGGPTAARATPVSRLHVSGAASWDKARRVVAKVEWHQGELLPRVGFIVTNLARSAERVVASTTIAGRRSSGSRKARTR